MRALKFLTLERAITDAIVQARFEAELYRCKPTTVLLCWARGKGMHEVVRP